MKQFCKQQKRQIDLGYVYCKGGMLYYDTTLTIHKELYNLVCDNKKWKTVM